MTPVQTIEIRRSKLRQRLGEIAAEDELTEELRSELTELEGKYADTEHQLRAAMIAEQAELPAAEESRAADPAFAELRRRASLKSFLMAAKKGKDVGGAEAELREELLGSWEGPNGVGMPLTMLEDPREELRADAPTTTTQHDGSTMSMPIAQRLFATPVMSEVLGYNMPTLGPGQHEFVLITSGNDASNVAEGGRRDTAAATFRTVTLKPVRATAGVLLSREAMASVGPNLEEALSRDIRGALANKFEDVAINGESTTNATVQGILRSVAETPSNAPSDPVDLAGYVGLTAGEVDGIHANSDTDVSVLMGRQTFAHAARIMSDSEEVTALTLLRQRAASVRVSAHMPAAVSTITKTIMRRGSRPDDAYMPIWDGIELIRDPYSNAAAGQVRITAIAMYNAVVQRTEAYVHRQLKIAA